MMNKIFKLTALAATLAVPTIWAQTAPNAGQILREQTPAPSAPRSSPSFQPQSPTPAETAPGGQVVVLRSVQIVGATVLPEAELLKTVGDIAGQSFDMAGIRALAMRVSNRYREAGYPFARAFIPPQDMKDGALRIEVLEGRYGDVKAVGDETRQNGVQRYLAPLASGKVIESRELERITLLIDDLPDIAITPVMRPGQTVGTGDLDVRVSRTAPVNGEVGLDNHGNYYSGEWRARATINVNGAFTLGDSMSASGLYSEQSLWLASVNYSLPLGVSGWRANAGYAHTSYDLGQGFEGNSGTAKVSTLGLTYPLLRSQQSNLNFNLNVQEKKLFNSRSYGADVENYSLMNTPVTLQFDHRDVLGAGGITYGSVAWTPGKLNSAAGSVEHFNKFNADIIRLQNLGGQWSVYGRFSAQKASRNLDSAEGFTLGGPTGIRAYPTGEASGDEGWLTQIELRYAADKLTPYIFYDHGRVKVDAQPALVTTPSPDKERAGVGAGVRYVLGSWNVDAALAWRTTGGTSEAVPGKDPKPRGWVNATYRF